MADCLAVSQELCCDYAGFYLLCTLAEGHDGEHQMRVSEVEGQETALYTVHWTRDGSIPQGSPVPRQYL